MGNQNGANFHGAGIPADAANLDGFGMEMSMVPKYQYVDFSSQQLVNVDCSVHFQKSLCFSLGCGHYSCLDCLDHYLVNQKMHLLLIRTS
mmetsp:Transcript_7142/g.5407  ORF Transcript_7142/g.5407 Transcript_7142/m.5407 type:complete len:90 (+) Transcript_7142:309-578(+)